MDRSTRVSNLDPGILNPELCHLPDVASRLRLPWGWALPRNSHSILGENAAFCSHQSPLCFLGQGPRLRGLTAELLPTPVDPEYPPQEREAATQAAEAAAWGPAVGQAS